MTAAPAPVSSTAAGALSAFLRGVERRALVVAELQCGDPTVAEQALVAVMRAFAGIASDLPMAQWPERFWSLLVHRAPLREPAGGHWPAPLEHLAGLAPSARLAFLLRIGGGLDEAAAAQILDLPMGDYQHALADACPRDAHGNPDAAGWRALAEQVQLRIRDLPATRLQRLQQPVAAPASQQPDAASWRTPVKSDAPTQRRPLKRQRGRRFPWKGVLIVAVTVGVLLGGAAWWKHARQAGEPAAEIPEGAVADDAQVTVEDLPADDLPTVAPTASPYAATDAAMLADPDLPTARDADLYAWFAAGGPVPVDESQAQPSRPEPATAGLETAAADE